jgi:hypothetical protein
LKIYLVLFITAWCSIGAEVWDGINRSNQYYIEGTTRCVDDLSLKDPERLNIAVAYFTYIMIAHFLQIYYFIRIACILWKNSKHLGDNKLESSQRLKRNKKAVKTILTMVIAILKTFALHNTDLSAFRELTEILLLIYCSFNSTFYIWGEMRDSRKLLCNFLQNYFVEVKTIALNYMTITFDRLWYIFHLTGGGGQWAGQWGHVPPPL